MIAKQRTTRQPATNFCWDLLFRHRQPPPFLGSCLSSKLVIEDSQVISDRSTEIKLGNELLYCTVKCDNGVQNLKFVYVCFHFDLQLD